MCDCGCGASLEGLDKRRRFFSDACRKASKRRGPVEEPAPAVVCTKVSDALLLELTELRMVDRVEAQIALGLARQLDDGSVRGAAYVSLSKEVDRRLDALRLKAELPDDPARAAEEAVAAKRAQLRAV